MSAHYRKYNENHEYHNRLVTYVDSNVVNIMIVLMGFFFT